MTTEEKKRGFATAIEQLDPHKAERLSSDENPLWKRRDLVSYWPDVTEDQYEECRDYIYQYTDVSNKKKQRRWVDDPAIGEETYSGRWRLVDVTYNRERRGSPGIIRRLRKGWAEKIEWDEALIVDARDLQIADSASNTDERYITVVFPNFNPEKIHSAITSLRATGTVTDPVLDGDQKTGTWEIVFTRSRKQEDGSFNIEMILANPRYTLITYTGRNTPAETKVTYLWNVPKRIAQSVVDASGYTSGTGTGAIANYSTGEGVVDLTIRQRTESAKISIELKTKDGALYTERMKYFWGLTKAEAEAFAVPEAGMYDANFNHPGWPEEGEDTEKGWVTRILQLGWTDGYYYAIVQGRKSETIPWGSGETFTKEAGRIYGKRPKWTKEGSYILGAPTVPADPTDYGDLDVKLHDDGLFWGSKTKLTENSGYEVLSGSFSATSERGLTYTFRQYGVIGGVRKRRLITITYDLYYTRFLSTALSRLKGDRGGGYGEINPLEGTRMDEFVNGYGVYGYRVYLVIGIQEGEWETDS